MDAAIKLAWLTLAAIHATPAAVVFAPGLAQRLYGVDAQGELGLLVVHRGALFLAVLAVCVYAALTPTARRAAGVVVATSVVGFLLVYARAGFPGGPLRTIATVDLFALVPLGLVLRAAWSARPA